MSASAHQSGKIGLWGAFENWLDRRLIGSRLEPFARKCVEKFDKKPLVGKLLFIVFFWTIVVMLVMFTGLLLFITDVPALRGVHFF